MISVAVSKLLGMWKAFYATEKWKIPSKDFHKLRKMEVLSYNLKKPFFPQTVHGIFVCVLLLGHFFYMVKIITLHITLPCFWQPLTLFYCFFMWTEIFLKKESR